MKSLAQQRTISRYPSNKRSNFPWKRCDDSESF
jgi:hypothetical protein